jgi:hypothetical protein
VTIQLEDGTVVDLGPAQVVEYGGGDDARRYSVTLRVNGEEIGTVESYRSNSWREHHGIRTSIRGRPKRWSGTLPAARSVGRHYWTRRAALEALVEAERIEAGA